ncbi:hypothetical protein JANAI62_37520 [Jannaschia pagri]|uniref:Uncharacterized protein n=1 Tax=Jannaschia pagri TaxID=2829797 RepID=A0ABQ4NRT6_9RHOB|nr:MULTISPECIES: hypothetical protein [unclassified Jannaschia]GIT93341.1 hypothetical protein JANAI61_37990 [Jannaschia sp. AI_61]GIT97129.1 hypothetical protein JANAI62_37520 [Jannaschia sp. AI_62]
MSTNPKTETNRPTYIAYHVAEPKPDTERWSNIGAFFAHKDGQGGSLILDALPIAFDGRIVLRVPRTDETAGGSQ